MIPCIEISEGSIRGPCGKEAYSDALKALLQVIPLGKVTTYKDLSFLLKTSPRALGVFLKRNDQPIIVPCHRVVRSNGEVGGYTWKGRFSPQIKRRLLLLEGVQISKNKVLRDSLCSLRKWLT